MGVDIVWLRDDFRLDDQPAIAATADRPTLYAYIHDESARNDRPPGGAAKWRLAQSLTAMEKRLAERGARLDVLRGPADRTILALAAAADARPRALDPAHRGRRDGPRRRSEGGVARARRRGLKLQRPPHARALGARQGGRRAGRDLLSLLAPASRLRRAFPAAARPRRLSAAPWPAHAPERVPVEALRLTPTAPDWSAELALGETPGEQGGLSALAHFAEARLRSYARDRDLLALDATSRLSAHLRFGEISARRAAAVAERAAAADPRLAQPAEKYLAELGWRDFAAALLTAHPDMAERPLRREFERFPYRDDRAGFRAWTRGETGYPIVDAGMRQLWRSGFMPNRARMIAASFLVKHFADRLAARRAMVLGHALRRRPRQQSAELAMGRRLRRRRRALFPHLQSGAAGGEVRPRRGLRAPLGPRTRAARIAAHPRAVAGAGGGARARRRRPRQKLPPPDARSRRRTRPCARGLRQRCAARGTTTRLSRFKREGRINYARRCAIDPWKAVGATRGERKSAPKDGQAKAIGCCGRPEVALRLHSERGANIPPPRSLRAPRLTGPPNKAGVLLAERRKGSAARPHRPRDFESAPGEKIDVKSILARRMTLAPHGRCAQLPQLPHPRCPSRL